DEIVWRPGAFELNDNVREATRVVDRSPLEDRPLEPVPGFSQVGGGSCQPGLIGSGDSKLQLSPVVTQQHERKRTLRLVLFGQFGDQPRDRVGEVHGLQTLACGNGVPDLLEAALKPRRQVWLRKGGWKVLGRF